MAIPAYLYAASFAQGLPVVAAANRGRPLPAPVVWLLAWSAWLLASDTVALAVAYAMGQNLWLAYLFTPVETALCVWGLSYWQTNGIIKLAYRLTIGILLFPTYFPLLLPGPHASADRFIWPLHAMLTLIAALYTLVSHSLRAERMISGEPWFWMTLGISINFGVVVALRPFSDALVETHPNWVKAAYVVKSGAQILAFALIAWGVLQLPRMGASPTVLDSNA